MSSQQNSIQSPSTPRSKCLPVNVETPVRSKRVSEQEYRSGDLSKGRLAVLQDLSGSIPEVPIDWLLEHIIPRVQVDVAMVTKTLQDQKLIVDGRWSVFPEDPLSSKSSEAEAFKPLQVVIRNIIHCAKPMPHADPLFEFCDNPHRAPVSRRSNDTRPDGYFFRPRNPEHPPVSRKSNSEAPLHHWDDIVLSAEYKKGTTDVDRDDNVQKILWSMHHVMRSDPCRRFTYGITVENTQMRIWFACRSTVFVTTPFNFIEDHEKLIRFVGSCTYATEVDIGWDPTIERVYVGGEVQYDITVHDVKNGNREDIVFRTTRILADFGADALRGRGTRVFEARRWNGETYIGAPVAIKDAWVDIDRDREGDILRELESDAQDEKDKETFQNHFMAFLHHGDVRINNESDTTLKTILRDYDVPTGSLFKLKLTVGAKIQRASSTGATPSCPSPAEALERDFKYAHKAHYRIIYKDVAEPIHSVTKLGDVFQTLGDAAIALEYMHRKEWVHRDISSGNIFFFKGYGKLSDLEYAKRRSSEGSHEIRTGTIDFMSIEVAAQEYEFPPQTDSPFPRFDLPAFRYNPLHDVESLWWIGVWVILYHRGNVSHEGDGEADAASRQLKIHRELFPGTMHHQPRGDALMLNMRFAKLYSCIPSTFFPVAAQLEHARRKLISKYRDAEAKLAADVPIIDSTAFSGIHDPFRDYFYAAKACSGDHILRPLSAILRPQKRSRQEDKRESEGQRKCRRVHKNKLPFNNGLILYAAE